MAEKKDPVFAAALVKISFEKKGKGRKMESALYLSILEDLGVTPEEVDQYLKEHREELEKLLKEKGGI